MWQPHSDGWGQQWPIQQSAYTNVPTDQVDWGALAQQWIAHREMTVHVPTGHGGGDISMHGHGSAYQSWGWNAPQANAGGSDWTSSSGLNSSWHSSGPLPPANQEAPAPSVPQFVDYGHGNYEVQGFDYNHGGIAAATSAPANWDYQATTVSTSSHPTWPPEPMPQPQPPPPPPDELVEDSAHSLLHMPDASVGVSDDHHRVHHHHHSKRQPQPPAAPAAVSSAVGSTDETAGFIDAAKRKILPSWIREGLEKMEREKAKKLEREKQEKEREEKEKLRIAAEKAALEALGSEHSGEPTLPRKSRFDMDESDGANGTRKEKAGASSNVGAGVVSTDVAQAGTTTLATTVKQLPIDPAVPDTVSESSTTTAAIDHPVESSGSDDDDRDEQLSAEEKQRQLIEKVKEMLTTVLRDVTDEQIRAVAKETYAKCRQNASKAPAKQLAKSSALASLTVFGGDDDTDDSGSDSDRGRARSAGSSSESDEEADYRLRKKKDEFRKAQRERLLRLEREEQNAKDVGSAVAKDKRADKKLDIVHGREEGKLSADNSHARLPGSSQPVAPAAHLGPTSASSNSPTEERADSRERPPRAESPGDQKPKYDRHEGSKSGSTKDQEHDTEVEFNQREDDVAPTKESMEDNSRKSTAGSSKRSLSPDNLRLASSSKSSKHGKTVKEDVKQRAARDAAPQMSKHERDKHDEPGHNTAISVSAANSEESQFGSQKAASKSLTREETSAETSGSSSSTSDSDSDASSSSSSRSRSKLKSSKRVAKPGRDAHEGAADKHYDRGSSHRHRSEGSHSKRSRDKARGSRKSEDRKVSSSSRKHSRRSPSRDSSRRHGNRRKDDKRDRDRHSPRSHSNRGRHSRSPVTDRRTASGKDRHRERSEDRHRKRSEDRPSKRKRRDASTSESDERGGKKASRKTSRSERRSRS